MSTTTPDKPPPDWQPRTRRIGANAVSVGERLGKPPWGNDLRRYDKAAGDEPMGVVEETVLPGWPVREREHERWVADVP